MKILVPIDFSDSIEYTLKYVLEIAIHTNGEIVLFYSDSESPRDSQVDRRSELEEIENNFKSKGIKSYSHYSTGMFIDNLTNDVLSNYDIDLIVLNSAHRDLIDDLFDNDSNTKKVIRSVSNNVLVLNQESGAIDFSKILFASNLELKERDAFKDFLEFAKHFPIDELHVMAVDTAGYFSQPTFVMKQCLEEFKEMASGYNCKVKFFPEFSVESGVTKYSELYDIKLVVMSNYIKHPIKRLFTGTNVEKVVSHSELPVFIVNR